MSDSKRNESSELPEDLTVDAEDYQPEQDGAAEAAEALDPRTQELESELAEVKDRLLRALAETENLRRRASRDVEDARKYAITSFARELLEVSDNLQRALASVPPEARGDNDPVRVLIDGVELTERTLASCLERFNVKQVRPELGDKFDHNLHQAMFEAETDQQPAGTIAQVLQPGYVIADRLLRPAMVGVAKRPAAAAQPGAGDAAGQVGQRLDTTA